MEHTSRTSPSVFAETFLDVQPHPTQSEFLEARAPTKVCVCGRRWGKTKAEAIDLVWSATTRPGTTQIIVAPTLDQASLSFNMAVEMIESGPLAPLVKVSTSPFPEIALNAGSGESQAVSKIIARPAGHNGRNIRGLGADRVIVDEAAYVPHRVITEVVQPMLASSPYGELVLISTPAGTNFLYELFERGQTGDPSVVSFQFPSHANPHLDRGYLERQRSELPETAFAAEYLAQFIEDDTAVFKSKYIAAAVDLSIESEEVPVDHAFAIGFDPAKWSDRSGVVVLDVTEQPYRVVKVMDISGRDYLVQADIVRALAHEYNDAPVLLDATSHDQMVEELQRVGVQAEGFRFTSMSKRELVEELVVALERQEVRIPPDMELRRELQYFQYQRTAAGNVKLGAPDRPGMHDDLVIALALAVHKGKTVAEPYFGWVDFGDTAENRLRQQHPNLPGSAVNMLWQLEQGVWPFPAYYRGNIRRFLG